MKTFAGLLGVLAMIHGIIVADESQPGIRPCGTYDISDLETHFRVAVATKKSSEQIEVVIVTMPKSDSETRKEFPVKTLKLLVRDQTGKTMLETPVAWTKARNRFGASVEQTATLTLSSDAVGRVRLCHIEPGSLAPPGHSVLIGFQSLAESASKTPGEAQ